MATRGVVVAGEDDLRRWLKATQAYVRDVDDIDRALDRYWHHHRSALARMYAFKTDLASWQDEVRAAHRRLAEVSERYRPLADEDRRGDGGDVPDALDRAGAAHHAAHLERRHPVAGDRGRRWRVVPDPRRLGR
jgi:hypothetical protein